MQHQNIGERIARGEATKINKTPPKRPSQRELLLEFIRMFEANGSMLYASTDKPIGNVALERLRQASTIGTLFEPMIARLNEIGIPTPQTLGGFIDVTGLAQWEVHTLGCYCNGTRVPGHVVASRLRNLLPRRRFFESLRALFGR